MTSQKTDEVTVTNPLNRRLIIAATSKDFKEDMEVLTMGRPDIVSDNINVTLPAFGEEVLFQFLSMQCNVSYEILNRHVYITV